jgi:hypothetical protein
MLRDYRCETGDVNVPRFLAACARHGLAVVPVERIIVAHVDTTQGPPAIHITTATKDAR